MNHKQALKNKLFLYVVLFGLLFLPFPTFSASVEFKDIKINNLGEGVIRIEWINNVATIGEVIYGEEATCLTSRITENKGASRWHVIEIGNLENDKTYYYQIIASDGKSINRSYVYDIEVDYGQEDSDDYDHAPEISDLRIEYISVTAAAISWTTDVPATSNVEYGLDADFGKKARSNKKTKEHYVVLKRLKPEKQYFIKVYSIDADKVESSEHFREFYTISEGKRNEEELIVSNFHPNSLDDPQVSATFVTVSFKTNNLADGYLRVKSKGEKTKKQEFSYNTKHYMTIMDLKPETCYEFYLNLKDVFSNRYKETYDICTTKKSDASLIEASGVNYTFSNDGKEKINTGSAIIVAGIQYERFPQVIGVFKTNDSPKIWLIANSSKHLITSEVSLADYGFSSSDVKTVSWPEIARYADAKLVKSPDKNTVYYLHKRIDGSIAKITVPSPAVFNSYESNRWEDIVTISQLDIDSYEEVRLLKNFNNGYIYYIIGDIKHYVSEEVFKRQGFNENEVLSVSTLHLESYKTGSGLK